MMKVYPEDAAALQAVFDRNSAITAAKRAKHEYWKGPRLPDPRPYHRTPQQIAEAMAATKRRIPDRDLPEHESPPIAPQYVLKRNEQTARLADAVKKPAKKAQQLKLL